MPELRVEVDAEVADALSTEADLLGFESETAYLAWIVENRAAIEQGTESAELLAAYQQRLAALEERLDAEGVDPGSVPGEPVRDAPAASPATDAEEESAAAGDAAGDGAAADDAAVGSTAAADAAADGAAADAAAPSSGPDAAPSAGSDASAADPSGADEAQTTLDEASSAPSSAADAGAADAAPADDTDAAPSAPADPSADTETPDPASTADDAGESTAASDGGTTAAEADITSMHLRPERVQRINEDPVARDAGELSDVETQRVDELSRRAVAETRRQLDRDVETGLSYSSSAALSSSDVRPGEDLADLDAIDVPGRSAEVEATRREVVGRALAFLRDEGSARRSDVVDALYEDHPAGYETADGWWRCVREGLRQVEPVDGGHVWSYEE